MMAKYYGLKYLKLKQKLLLSETLLPAQLTTNISSTKTDDLPADIETRIPLIAEKLGVQKTVSSSDVTVGKESVSETKTVDVDVTHEELEVERRPATDTTTTEGPVTSRQEVKVPLKSEHVEVTKTPYVKEEVVIRKKPVTERKEVTEEVRSEEVDVDK